MKQLRVAILGAGRIARQMAETLRGMDTVEAYAIASRDYDRAKSYAREYGFTTAYGSYEDMLADDKVELVYVATPHSHHAQHMKMILDAGKHVLCEKAFTVNAKEAREVLELSQKKGLLVAEAIWPRYMPLAKYLQELCASDIIGNITALNATLGYPVQNKARLTDPCLAGGSLLDIGIYPLTFASIAFGDDVTNITTSAVMGETGVDMYSTIGLTYGDGKMANIFNSCACSTDRRGVIFGDKGYIVAENCNNFERVTVYNKEFQVVSAKERPQQITGFEYEVQAAVDSIRNGRIECPEMPHAQIIGMMELMDSIREIWGMRYPME